MSQLLLEWRYWPMHHLLTYRLGSLCFPIHRTSGTGPIHNYLQVSPGTEIAQRDIKQLKIVTTIAPTLSDILVIKIILVIVIVSFLIIILVII